MIVIPGQKIWLQFRTLRAVQRWCPWLYAALVLTMWYLQKYMNKLIHHHIPQWSGFQYSEINMLQHLPEWMVNRIENSLFQRSCFASMIFGYHDRLLYYDEIIFNAWKWEKIYWERRKRMWIHLFRLTVQTNPLTSQGHPVATANYVTHRWHTQKP